MKNIVIIGCLFIIGWSFSSFINFGYIQTNLKPLASIAFVGVSVIMLLLNKRAIEMHEAKQAIVTGVATGILIMMLTGMFLFGFENRIGPRSLFSVASLPPLATSACFMLFCIYAFVFLYGHGHFKKHGLFIISILILIPSILALMGHIIGSSVLVFYINDSDKGMSLQGAVLFTMLSTLMILKTKELYVS